MSEFNLDPNMSEDDAIQFMTWLMIDAKLAHMQQPQGALKIAQALDMPVSAVTPEYIDRLACGAMALSMGAVPFALMKLMGGPVRLASLMLTREEGREKMSPSSLTQKLTEGMAELTPSAAKLITEAVVINAARICLLDWLEAGENLTQEEMKMDSQLYFALLMERAGVSFKSVREELKEHSETLPADQYLNLPKALRDQLETWDWENDQPSE